VDRSGDHHLWLGSRTPRGHGQLRVDGRLRTAAQVAWELERGEAPSGRRVRGCPDEPSCVRIEHLSLAGKTSTEVSGRGKRGGGSISKVGVNKWKVTVDVGRDETGRRRRLTRVIHGSKGQAKQAMASLMVDLAEGRLRPSPAAGTCTVNELMHWYLEFARDVRGLEHSTLTGYRDAYDKWLADQIGDRVADRLSPADLDTAFGHMRRAGLSRSRMNNALSGLSGAYKWGRRHSKVAINPVVGFELPLSTKAPKTTSTPELHELLRILDGAEEHDPEISPVLNLAATTGMRRGELVGLRRDRLRFNRNELLVDTAVNDAGGAVVVKPTKTKRSRIVALDADTIGMLRTHLDEMDRRAQLCGVEIASDGYVFSLDPACIEPMRPEFLTRRMRLLRKTLGIDPGDFDATILALRKWTSTELMDAGFNPSAISGRQGHTVQVMLHHYSSRRRSADQAAAEHLGSRLRREGRPPSSRTDGGPASSLPPG
jgi:integrase